MPTSLLAQPSRGSRGCLAAFFAVFALVGVAVAIPAFVRPAFRVLAARSWPAVTCDIRESRVGSHPGGRSTTYSIDVLYTYTIDDRRYEGRHYDFLGGSSSGSAGKQAIV